MDFGYPALLFLGDVNPIDAKTAYGIAYWRKDACLGQYRMSGATADLKLPDMEPAAAKAQGAKSMIVGVANEGGFIPDHWLPPIHAALDAGLDIVAGLHDRLNDNAEIAEHARRVGRKLIDVRYPTGKIPTGNGAKRSGRRQMIEAWCSLNRSIV